MERTFSRRHAMLAIAGTTLLPNLAPAAAPTVRLTPAADRNLFRVRLQLEIQGQVDVPDNAMVSTDGSRQFALEAESLLDYEERWTRGAEGAPVAARRYYYQATSDGAIHNSRQQLELRDEARRVEVRLAGSRTVAHGLRTQLMAEELDLLRHPAASLAVDGLLPGRQVRPQETWTIGEQELARLFDLDAVQETDVQGRLAAVEGTDAKVEFSGRLAGSVDGVPTSLQVAGKLTFALRERAVTWLALVIRERREIGKAEPGFDVRAKVQMVRRPLSEPNAVKETRPVAVEEPVAPEKLLVDVRGQAGFSALCDRRWRVMADAPRLTVLRMIESDRVIAQCEVRPLPSLRAGEQLTLEAFQDEIRQALGSQFGALLEAEERASSAGVRILRTAVQGQVEDVPVYWVYLHLSDDSGRRTAAVFTLEPSQSEQFGASGVQFASSFQFREPKRRAAQGDKKGSGEGAAAETAAAETAEKR